MNVPVGLSVKSGVGAAGVEAGGLDPAPPPQAASNKGNKLVPANFLFLNNFLKSLSACLRRNVVRVGTAFAVAALSALQFSAAAAWAESREADEREFKIVQQSEMEWTAVAAFPGLEAVLLPPGEVYLLAVFAAVKPLISTARTWFSSCACHTTSLFS